MVTDGCSRIDEAGSSGFLGVTVGIKNEKKSQIRGGGEADKSSSVITAQALGQHLCPNAWLSMSIGS